jgi:hypothetical protein
MMSDFPELDFDQQMAVMGVIGDAAAGMLHNYLKLQILPFARNAIGISALHKCRLAAGDLPVAPARRLLLQRDFRIADRDHSEQ